MKPLSSDYPVEFIMGACPACGEDLIAGVLVDPNLSEPVVHTAAEDRSQVTINMTADPRIVGMAVSHQCGGARFPEIVKDHHDSLAELPLDERIRNGL